MNFQNTSKKKIEEYEQEIRELKFKLVKEQERCDNILRDARLQWEEKTELLKSQVEDLFVKKEKQYAENIEKLNAHYRIELQNEKKRADDSISEIKKQCDEKIKEVLKYAEEAINQVKNDLLSKQKDLQEKNEKELLINLSMSVEEYTASVGNAIKTLNVQSIMDKFSELSLQLNKRIDGIEQNLQKTIVSVEKNIDCNLNRIELASNRIAKSIEDIDETLCDELEDDESSDNNYSYDSLEYDLQEIKSAIYDTKDIAQSARWAADEAKYAAESARSAAEEAKSAANSAQWAAESSKY